MKGVLLGIAVVIDGSDGEQDGLVGVFGTHLLEEGHLADKVVDVAPGAVGLDLHNDGDVIVEQEKVHLQSASGGFFVTLEILPASVDVVAFFLEQPYGGGFHEAFNDVPGGGGELVGEFLEFAVGLLHLSVSLLHLPAGLFYDLASFFDQLICFLYSAVSLLHSAVSLLHLEVGLVDEFLGVAHHLAEFVPVATLSLLFALCVDFVCHSSASFTS